MHVLLQDGLNDQQMPGHIKTQNRTDHAQWIFLNKCKTLQIGTINLSELKEKEEEVIMLMKERNLDIIGLCETLLTGQGTNILHDDCKLFNMGGMEARHKWDS